MFKLGINNCCPKEKNRKFDLIFVKCFDKRRRVDIVDDLNRKSVLIEYLKAKEK
jgi:hypothetical protein